MFRRNNQLNAPRFEDEGTTVGPGILGRAGEAAGGGKRRLISWLQEPLAARQRGGVAVREAQDLWDVWRTAHATGAAKQMNIRTTAEATIMLSRGIFLSMVDGEI
jgi:hypothetical protein